ncbi:hypothetical protein GQ43DRAFT_462126 [Delitschia confertaspora ATCC 74209]|uniref:Uncharacterized protein n=1 Tax=Delitschia confertaspora ATCC 74209 TaxID=1513339 RepID=A0A9P4N0C7_9PLEO|nr:hypothetical protein GQ43DRAFT_462126 [Delitschia confertaspora ATCC 74209]
MDQPQLHRTVINDYYYNRAHSLSNVLGSRKIHLVNDTIGHVYLSRVSKQMLFFFCGFHNVTRYLRNVQDATPFTAKQRLELPDGKFEFFGLKCVIAWMQDACRNPLNHMVEFRSEYNLMTTISITRALRVLGLHQDAHRIYRWIHKTWIKAPLTLGLATEVCANFPQDSKWWYHVVEKVKGTLEDGRSSKEWPLKKEIVTALEDTKNEASWIQDLGSRLSGAMSNAVFTPESLLERQIRLMKMSQTMSERETVGGRTVAAEEEGKEVTSNSVKSLLSEALTGSPTPIFPEVDLHDGLAKVDAEDDVVSGKEDSPSLLKSMFEKPDSAVPEECIVTRRMTI